MIDRAWRAAGRVLTLFVICLAIASAPLRAQEPPSEPTQQQLQDTELQRQLEQGLEPEQELEEQEEEEIGPFEVRDIQVDVTDETAASARDKALRDGERRAYQQMISRVAPADDLPRMSAVSDAEIGTLIKDFWVADEKLSAVRYVATLNYTFHRDRVYALLREKNVAFTTRETKSILVLPVYEAAGGPVLWETVNSWRTAWEGQVASSELALRLPVDDATDRDMITADRALYGDRFSLEQLARRYNADKLVVVAAKPLGLDTAAPTGVRVRTIRYDAEGIQSRTQQYPGSANEREADLMRRAAAQTDTALQAAIKREATAAAAAGQTLPVVVPLSGLDDWLAVRRRLADTPAVADVQVIVLSRNEVRANIAYLGELDRLRSTLRGAGLALKEQTGQWVLRATGEERQLTQ